MLDLHRYKDRMHWNPKFSSLPSRIDESLWRVDQGGNDRLVTLSPLIHLLLWREILKII